MTDNHGTWNFSGTGDMRSGTSTFNNSGVFDVQINSNFLNNLGGAGQFNNTGTLKKTGTGTTLFGVGVDNDGSLLANTGTFEFSNGDGGANVSSGSYSVPATISFTNGTHDLAAASSVSGAGIVRFQGGTVNVLGSYSPTKTEITAGTVNFEAAATTTWLDQSGGVLAGSGTFTINGPSPASSWTTGTMTGTGTTRLAPGATMNVSGPRRQGCNRGPHDRQRRHLEPLRHGRHALGGVDLHQQRCLRYPDRRQLPEQPRRHRPVQQHRHAQEDRCERDVDHRHGFGQPDRRHDPRSGGDAQPTSHVHELWHRRRSRRHCPALDRHVHELRRHHAHRRDVSRRRHVPLQQRQHRHQRREDRPRRSCVGHHGQRGDSGERARRLQPQRDGRRLPDHQRAEPLHLHRSRTEHGQRRRTRRHRDDLRERHERRRHRRSGRFSRNADDQRQLHAERDRDSQGRDRERRELRQARRHGHRRSREPERHGRRRQRRPLRPAGRDGAAHRRRHDPDRNSSRPSSTTSWPIAPTRRGTARRSPT